LFIFFSKLFVPKRKVWPRIGMNKHELVVFFREYQRLSMAKYFMYQIILTATCVSTNQF